MYDLLTSWTVIRDSSRFHPGNDVSIFTLKINHELITYLSFQIISKLILNVCIYSFCYANYFDRLTDGRWRFFPPDEFEI